MPLKWFLGRKKRRQVINSLTLTNASCPTSHRFGIMNSRNIAPVRKTRQASAGILPRFVFRKRRRRRTTANTLHYTTHKERARELVHERLIHWNQFYNLSYGRIAIRNQRSRWGSCSTKQNLNFNYRIIFLPEALVDYIVVHELCHLAEFNHSASFWNHVGKTLPDYHERKSQLQAIALDSFV